MNKIEKILVPIAGKLSSNKILQGISKGLMSLMPAMILGAFAQLLNQLPISIYQEFLINTGLSTVLTDIVNVANNMLALFTSFAIAYAYVSAEKNKDGFAAGAISMLVFLFMTPFETTGEGYTAVTNLPLSWTGARGLFTSMFVAIVVAKLYTVLINKNIMIKMPSGVPEFVSKSFSSIVPAIIIAVPFIVLRLVLAATPFGNLHQLIYGIIQVPVSHIGTSIWAALLIQLLTGFCWFFGVHGIAVLSVILPVWMAADVENVTAVASGVANADLPNMITYNWVNSVATIGGAGATMGLVILMTFFAKAKKHKVFGKMAIIPSIFNINEPVVFGLPCVLNATLALPFILLPVFFIALAYILVNIGILPVSNGLGAPAGTPLIIQGLFNGGWRLAVYQVFAVFASIIVYYPFFRILDKQAYKEELEVGE
ncbi:PTS system, cellobiose-specific IIC component [Enterococcus sp. AZ178]|uniref:PTS sugar transporter subunit IIC n=1 Tax=Enterococcus sp. AZ178 TaxID=2774822 RepID=UPI003F274E9F